MSRNSIFWGIILIILGTFIILNNFGYLNFNFWMVLGPLMLILFGIWVLIGPWVNKSDSETAVVPLGQYKKAALQFNFAAGKLRIEGISKLDSLLEGELSGGFDLVHSTKGEIEVVKLDLKPFFVPIVWIPSGIDWNIKLNDSIPLSLDLKTGATDTYVDLTGLKIEKFELGTGASSTTIVLPSVAGSGKYVIKSGLAAVNVRIPQGVAARIRASAGLGIVNVDRSRFPRQMGEYKSNDFETATARVDLIVETGLGSVDIH